MARLFHGYVGLLQRHTLLTQMATGGVTSGLGDIIYQQGIEKRGWKDHEFYRTRRLVLYGAFCFAPVSNRWHAIMSRIKTGGKWTTLGSRMAVDMTIFAPFATSWFYFWQGTMEGRPFNSTAEMQGIKERLRERLWGTVWKQWAFFGPAQIINLTLIPVYARPPFMNLFAIAWSVFLAGAQSVGAIAPPTEKGLQVGQESMAQVAVEVME